MTYPQAGPTPAVKTRGRRELILEMLRASSGPLTISVIAGRLGVHPNTVRFHLDGLVESGRVERLVGKSSGPGRRPVVYRASRAMDRNGPSNYRLLATIFTDHLEVTTGDPAGMAAELGRRWGPSLIEPSQRQAAPTRAEAVTRVVGVLTDLGFQPEPPRGGRSREIRLRHCPFLGLVDEHGEVICAVHMGLMQGALAAMKAPVTVDRLDPFVEPDLCVARLAATGGRA